MTDSYHFGERADVVCVVAALASAPPKIAYRVSRKSKNKSFGIDNDEEILVRPPNVQQQAIDWLKTQQVVVIP